MLTKKIHTLLAIQGINIFSFDSFFKHYFFFSGHLWSLHIC